MEAIKKPHEAVNWNTADNEYVSIFWEQNIKQFWVDTEYVPSRDKKIYDKLDPITKDTYNKVLGGLTLLDTLQSHTGMTSVIPHIDSLQNRSVLSFMCMMESIHAKSYSTIFTTVCSNEVIDEIFEWVKENKHLQYKIDVIEGFYKKLYVPHKVDDKDLYMALVASILLESFLFYSGFFFPLWLSGQGKMVGSGDIIKKIVADESIHGIFVGLQAQEIRSRLSKEDLDYVLKITDDTFNDLLRNELEYTKLLYDELGLTSEVEEYLKYNANKAYTNLGLPNPYEHVEINPIVLNSLNLESTQHDFFSNKSPNYEKDVNPTYINDDDLNDLNVDLGDI